MAWPVLRQDGFQITANAWNEIVSSLSAWGGDVNAGGHNLSALGYVTFYNNGYNGGVNGLLRTRGTVNDNDAVQEWGPGGGSGGYAAMQLVKTRDIDGDFHFKTYSAGGAADAPKIQFGTLGDPTLLVLDTVNWRVGIGTGSPAYKLHLLGSVFAGWQTFNPGDREFYRLGDAAHGMAAEVAKGLIFSVYKGGGSGAFGADSLDAITVLDSSGYVGFGTPTPSGQVTIYGSGAGEYGHLYIHGTSNAGAIIRLQHGSNPSYWDILQGLFTADDFVICHGGITADKCAMRITGGYVGFGTAVPPRHLSLDSPDYTEFVIGSRMTADATYGRFWGFAVDPTAPTLSIRSLPADFSGAHNVVTFHPDAVSQFYNRLGISVPNTGLAAFTVSDNVWATFQISFPENGSTQFNNGGGDVWLKESAGNVIFRVTGGPYDANMFNSSVQFWVEETNHLLYLRHKDSSGVLRSILLGTLA